METVTRQTIMPFVELTCITTDKFKTGSVSVNLVTQLSAKDASKSALLPRVLRRGTAEHPDMNSISRVLDELYGAQVFPVIRKQGENLSVGLYASFIDDDFLPKGEMVLEKVISLVGEMLLSPATRGGLLIAEYVESEKQQLIDEIKSARSEKISYALEQLISSMCSGEAYGTPKLGTEAAAASITPRSLTKHYRNILASSKIEIIYCGAAGLKRVSQALLDAFSALPRSGDISSPVTEVLTAPRTGKPAIISEEMDVSQGKLTMGFRIGRAIMEPNYPALMVFNAIVGGCVTSKLFTNVREKMSLCYYASSMVEKLKGLLIIYSGVEFSNFQTAFNEIMCQLEAVKNGEITNDELDGARKAVSTALRSMVDSPAGTESFYFESAISGILLSPGELANLAEAVTADDIVNIARGVVLDTVHCLTTKGGAKVEL